MELEYELTADDYRAFARHSTRRVKRIRRPWQAHAMSMALGVLTAVALLVTRPPATAFQDLLGVFVLLVLLALVTMYSARLKVRRYLEAVYQEGPSVITMSLALLPTGIEYRSSLGSGIDLWHAFGNVEHGDQHLFIRAGIAGVKIIPKRAFRDEQHMQAFLDEMRRLRAEAAGAASAPSTADNSSSASLQ